MTKSQRLKIAASIAFGGCGLGASIYSLTLSGPVSDHAIMLLFTLGLPAALIFGLWRKPKGT